MGEYYAVVLRAVAELEPNTAELRSQVYERARSALAAKLQALKPPLSGADRMKARLELEEASRAIEADIEKAAGYGMTFRQYSHHLHVAEALRAVSAQLTQRRHGASVALTRESTFGFVFAAGEADHGAAIAPFFQKRLAEIRHSAETLQERVAPLRDVPGWAGLAHGLAMFCRCLRAPGEDIVAGIAPLLVLSVALAAYVERSEDARSGQAMGLNPLDPAVLDPLKDFVFAAGPWVRRFPSGRILDDEAHAFVRPASDVQPGLNLLRRATEAGLVREDDATVAWVALDAARGESSPAGKARGWAVETMRNIAIALIKVLGQSAQFGDGGEAKIAAFVPLAQRIENVVLRGAPDLFALLSPVLDDGGATLRDALTMLAEAAPDTADGPGKSV